MSQLFPSDGPSPAFKLYSSLNPNQKEFVRRVITNVAELGRALLYEGQTIQGQQQISVVNTLSALTLSVASARAFLGGESKPDEKTLAVMIVTIHDVLHPGVIAFKLGAPNEESN